METDPNTHTHGAMMCFGGYVYWSHFLCQDWTRRHFNESEQNDMFISLTANTDEIRSAGSPFYNHTIYLSFKYFCNFKPAMRLRFHNLVIRQNLLTTGQNDESVCTYGSGYKDMMRVRRDAANHCKDTRGHLSCTAVIRNCLLLSRVSHKHSYSSKCLSHMHKHKHTHS